MSVGIDTLIRIEDELAIVNEGDVEVTDVLELPVLHEEVSAIETKMQTTDPNNARALRELAMQLYVRSQRIEAIQKIAIENGVISPGLPEV